MPSISMKTIPTPDQVEQRQPYVETPIDDTYIRRFILATENPPQEVRDGVLTILVPTGRLQEDMARIPAAATAAAHRAIEAKGWRKIGEKPLGGREHGHYDLWQPASQ